MSKDLKLTPKQCKEVFEKTGVTLTNMPPERVEEVMFVVIDILKPEKEFETFQEQSDFFSEVISNTYKVSKADEKN